MCLLEKKTGHKHPYQTDMQAWAFVPRQTYPNQPCFLSSSHACVKALLTVYFPLSAWKPLMGM